MSRLALVLLFGLPAAGFAQMTFGDLEKKLGVETMCANLSKGDFAAASAPIQRKTVSRELTFSTVINWLAGQIKSPYHEIAASRQFQDLPKDQGPIKACRGGGLTLFGDEIMLPLYLQYEKSRLTVALRYDHPFNPKLQFIEIGSVEKLKPGQQPPDAFEKKVGEFKEKLDKLENARKAP